MTKIIIICWIVLKDLFEILISLINMFYSLSKKRMIPTTLNSIISEDRFRLSQKYLKDKTIFGLVTNLFGLLYSLFILLLLLPILENWSKNLSQSILWQGLFFFGSIYLLQFLFSIPFSFYDNFKIEAKYGFNKTTFTTFFVDSIKTILLSMILGGFILSGILYFIIHYRVWWWQLSLITTLFFLLAIWLFPVVLMPIFNRFMPLKDSELKESILAFTQKNHIKISKIFVMDASKRTSHGNAFLTGIGFSRRLVLYDTILSYPKEEILSIIAHEWGHHKHEDIFKQIVVSSLSILLILYLSNLVFSLPILQSQFKIMEPYSILYVAMILISPILFYISPFNSFMTRKQEYAADLFSLLMTKDIKSSINSLKRLISDNLSNLNPHPLYRLFYYTHPSPNERIMYLLKKAEECKIS